MTEDRILVVTDQLPYPPRNSVTLPLFHLVEQLRRSHAVQICLLQGPGGEDQRPWLADNERRFGPVLRVVQPRRGLGDLVLTCSSLQSRNFALGIALGRGEQPNHDKLAEGEFTAPVLIELAASQDVDMPVSNAVAAILAGRATIDAAIEGLLTRPFKAEE